MRHSEKHLQPAVFLNSPANGAVWWVPKKHHNFDCTSWRLHQGCTFVSIAVFISRMRL
jgi:hypothetical protein